MSLNSFDKNKDEEFKNEVSDAINKSQKIKIPSNSNTHKEFKKSVTFSITDKQLEIIEAEARKRGFKNKSEFLSFIIENI